MTQPEFARFVVSERKRGADHQSRWDQIPTRMERLKKIGANKLSRTDADSRFPPDLRGFTLGYTAMVAVSEDHLIVSE